MIRFIDKDFDRFEEMKKLCRDDPFGVRILSYYVTYDISLSFIDFWYQEDKNGRMIAVISRFEDRYTVFSKYTRNKTKLLELQEFISFRSPGAVMLDFRLRLDFEKPVDVIIGDVLKFKKSEAKFKDIKNDVFERPTTVNYYTILKLNENDKFTVPDYMHFLSDVTYRKNRKRIALFGLKHEDSVASVCMTVSECDDAVILGAVATAPQYKRMGYCSKLVNRAASLMSLDNKDVYIFSMQDKTTKLYKKIGFKKSHNFIEYIFR